MKSKENSVRKEQVKGQVAVEYLVISAFLLGIVGVFFIYSLQSYNETMISNTARTAVETIAKTADQAASFGNGTVVFAEVVLPNGVQECTAVLREVSCIVETPSGIREFFENTKALLTESAIFKNSPPNAAKHVIKAVYNDGNVLLSEWSG